MGFSLTTGSCVMHWVSTPRGMQRLSLKKAAGTGRPLEPGLQVMHGRLFGMRQSKAHQWIHVLLPVLLTALRTLGDAPARSLTALAQRLGVSETDAATVVVPLEEEPASVVAVPDVAPVSPLLCELARKKENPSLTAV